jgi:hypothetical protein
VTSTGTRSGSELRGTGAGPAGRALRRGRQYLREISGDGVHFGLLRSWGGRLTTVLA